MTTDIEAFIGQEGRDKAIQEVRKQIDAAGVEYMYYQFVSVTGRIMGKGIPAAVVTGQLAGAGIDVLATAPHRDRPDRNRREHRQRDQDRHER